MGATRGSTSSGLSSTTGAVVAPSAASALGRAGAVVAGRVAGVAAPGAAAALAGAGATAGAPGLGCAGTGGGGGGAWPKTSGVVGAKAIRAEAAYVMIRVRAVM